MPNPSERCEKRLCKSHLSDFYRSIVSFPTQGETGITHKDSYSLDAEVGKNSYKDHRAMFFRNYKGNRHPFSFSSLPVLLSSFSFFSDVQPQVPPGAPQTVRKGGHFFLSLVLGKTVNCIRHFSLSISSLTPSYPYQKDIHLN